MLPDELYHAGIKGMKWGVRKTPEQRAAKQDAKAAKYDAKAAAVKEGLFRATTQKSVNIRRGYQLGVSAYNNKKLFETKYPGAGRAKVEKLVDMGVSAMNVRNVKADYQFKAETARRKAASIRAKSMKDVNAVKSKATFESSVAKAKKAMADPYNQQKALRITKRTVTVANTLYQNRKAIAQVANIGAGYLAKKIIKDRATREAATSSIKRLAEFSNSTKFEKSMKPGIIYLMNPDGTGTKAGTFKVH